MDLKTESRIKLAFGVITAVIASSSLIYFEEVGFILKKYLMLKDYFLTLIVGLLGFTIALIPFSIQMFNLKGDIAKMLRDDSEGYIKEYIQRMMKLIKLMLFFIIVLMVMTFYDNMILFFRYLSLIIYSITIVFFIRSLYLLVFYDLQILVNLFFSSFKKD